MATRGLLIGLLSSVLALGAMLAGCSTPSTESTSSGTVTKTAATTAPSPVTPQTSVATPTATAAATPLPTARTLGADLCAEFPAAVISEMLGKPIERAEHKSSGPSDVCQYYLAGGNGAFLSLRHSNLSVENQKKGALALKRMLQTDARIGMEHLVVVQEDGNINSIYLVLNANHFVALDRTSLKVASNEELIEVAAKVAAYLK
jgi:PBP1b-binding outer membrane lipoprotein LpoB